MILSLFLFSYISLLLYFKKTKIDIAIVSVINKVGVILKAVFRGMFQNKQTVAFQQVVPEDQVWNSSQFFQLIGWIGKDHIKLRMAALDIFKYICF